MIHWAAIASARAVRVLLQLALLFFICGPAFADDDPATLERNVKAAFLYKFAAYVEWPDTVFAASDSPIVIGVAGDEAMYAELSRITAGRQVGGRPLATRWVGDAEALGGLNILFVARSENARLQQYVKASQSRPILLVTESDNARGQGSIINFVVVDGRVRFWIANQEAEKRGLKLSSRLLSVAQNVQTGSP